MKNFKNFLIVALFFVSATVLAQTKVTGTVVDETGEPLPGASVVEKGTTNGTSTDFDGKFILNSKSNSGTAVVSFVGYKTKEVAYSGAGDLGTIQLEEDGAILDEIVVTATSFAVDRKTPVAVSTVKAADIERKLGTQEFPEILKSTPGVYATKAGGGFGDGRINMRGFNSQNVAVMINGVPVNDMENGRVFWSNWAGLADVTSAMQTQRGLGASKVAVPSIGGTINIVTKSTDVEKGGNVMMSTGNNGFQKYGFTLSTGLMDNGFAASVSLAETTGEGYVMGTQFAGWNYFFNLSKKFNDEHTVTFTSFGAPQRHGQRQNRSKISHYRNSKDGIRYNPDWGYRNGQIVHVEDNFYHKNQTSLNHYWTISEDSSLSTALYYSIGTGGGGGTRGNTAKFALPNDAGSSPYRQDNFGPIDLDLIAQENIARGALGSESILRASRNDHNWYGILSTFKSALSEELDLVAGIDFRQYTGIHFQEVTNLLGGQYFLDDNDVNNPNRAAQVGDKVNYNNDGIVGWQGGFAQLEYGTESFNAFVSTSFSNTSYERVDYFNYLDSDPLQTSPKFNFFAGGVKGGANYRLDDVNNVFVNVGYFERPADFRSVFPRFNNVNTNENAPNQKIFSMELGYGLRGEKFAANLNLYRTRWNDRTFVRRTFDQAGTEFSANIQGVNALHQGIEGDFTWRPSDKLNVTGMFSFGDWYWDNDIIDAEVYNDSQQLVGNIDLLIKGARVADAAQTTAALGVLYKFWDKSSLTFDYNYFGGLYADFDILQSANFTAVGDTKQPSTRQGSTWKMPNYSTLDASFRHGFTFGDFDTTLTLRVNNVLNAEFITDALDGATSSASDALVWFGAGRTFSLSAKIKF